MTLIIKILSVGLLHLAFFASYPETGPSGNYYLAVSLLLWTGFTLFANTAAKVVKLFNGPLGALFNLAVFFLMGLALAFTMPQQDKTSVLEKMQKGSYPDRATLNKGMKRFGINLDREIEKNLEKLGDKAKETAQEVKKN